MATAALPCSLSRPVAVLAPPLVPCSSTSFAPREHRIRAAVLHTSARLAQDYESDFRPPETVAKGTFSEILHSSDNEQSVMLRFVWLDKSLGLALDHVFPGYGAIPMTPYYFFPQSDALEELKKNIKSQHWISVGRTKAILSQAEELLYLWQNTAI